LNKLFNQFGLAKNLEDFSDIDSSTSYNTRSPTKKSSIQFQRNGQKSQNLSINQSKRLVVGKNLKQKDKFSTINGK
jgi:hypothetical protein